MTAGDTGVAGGDVLLRFADAALGRDYTALASVRREVVRARRYDAEPGSPLFAVVRECLPALVTVAVLEFVLVWNDYVVGILLGGPESGQVTFVLAEQARQFVTSESVMAAGAVVATAIPLGLVIATGDLLVRGFTSGVRQAPPSPGTRGDEESA